MLRIGLSLVVVAALSLPVLTQTRPSFAGKWEIIAEKSTPSTRPPGFPAPQPLTLSQDATTITVSRVAFTPAMGSQPQGPEIPFTLTYTFDDKDHPEPKPVPPLPTGPASEPSIPAGAVISRMTIAEQTYRAAWTGDQLVITSRSISKIDPPPPNYVPTERVTKTTYSIDKDGMLVIETARTSGAPSSGTSSQPAPITVRSVHRKIS